jgi:hypothetical protein
VPHHELRALRDTVRGQAADGVLGHNVPAALRRCPLDDDLGFAMVLVTRRPSLPLAPSCLSDEGSIAGRVRAGHGINPGSAYLLFPAGAPAGEAALTPIFLLLQDHVMISSGNLPSPAWRADAPRGSEPERPDARDNTGRRSESAHSFHRGSLRARIRTSGSPYCGEGNCSAKVSGSAHGQDLT